MRLRHEPRPGWSLLAALILASTLLPNLQAASASTDASNVGSQSDDSDKRSGRVYVATRVSGRPPRVDGRLDDPCWTIDGTWAGDYTQFAPEHGAEPTEPTELKVLFDDRHLYVAFRVFESDPANIRRKAGPRDDFEGDIVGVTFDSYHDQRTGFEFDLTAAGQKLDVLLKNYDWDTTWNAVWDGKVATTTDGWTAEMRIPLSQLRYSGRHPQVWGMHSWRWITRDKQESQWSLLANDDTGFVRSFGELRGLELPPPRRNIELLPYASYTYTLRPDRPDDPFDGNSARLGGGLDAKIALSTSITLDATINPDFGQVEADPSELNLTAFETFLAERRPFFLEGKHIFAFPFGDEEVFYSRRIGAPPSLGADASPSRAPEGTTILGAAKITGKTANGLAFGLLEAVTQGENAEVIDPETGAVRHVPVEPLTNYLVTRAQQDLDDGNLILGGVFSGVYRHFTDARTSESLARTSLVSGVDVTRYWRDREYFIETSVLGSRISGTPSAIAQLQLASSRYFQRPDAGYTTYDPTRDSLAGWGGRVRSGKGGKGHWRWWTELEAKSPGLELNDVGFLRQADRISQTNRLRYVVNEPSRLFRNYNVALTQSNRRTFGSERLPSELSLDAYFDLQNKWSIELDADYAASGLDPALLRGGPAVRIPARSHFDVSLNSDYDKKLAWSGSWARTTAAHDAFTQSSISTRLTFRPLSQLKFSVAAESNHVRDDLHFVPVTNPSDGSRFVVAHLESETTNFVVRAQYFIRPELSLQYYGSPFAGTAIYSRFRRVTAPKATDFNSLATPLGEPLHSADGYLFDENGDGTIDFSVARPDRLFGELRSNLVLRWEYAAGSNLYVVWSNSRSTEASTGNLTTSGAFRALRGADSVNTLLIKCSYWFSN